VLFLYYLMMQLKFGVDQIVGAAAPTVADVYRTQAGKSDDPFPTLQGTAREPLLRHANDPGPSGQSVADRAPRGGDHRRG
jgi:hypothetical protein